MTQPPALRLSDVLATLRQCTFENNDFAIWASSGRTTIDRCRITNCDVALFAEVSAAGTPGRVDLSHSIIWDSCARTGPSMASSPGVDLRLDHCTVRHDCTGLGAVIAGPNVQVANSIISRPFGAPLSETGSVVFRIA